MSSAQQALVEKNKQDVVVKKQEELTPEELQEEMIKAISALEQSLFSQAALEHQRLVKTRQLSSMLEDDIFSDENYSFLSPRDKVRLYEALVNSNKISLEFLNSLHSNVAVGIDIINQVKMLKELKEKSEHKANKKVDARIKELKKKLLQGLQEKVKQKGE